jgi:predicted PurR-regulated permease PerM
MDEQVNKARWIAVLIATALALYLCWLILKPFISVLEWATVLVIVFYPIHKLITRRIKRRGLSALVSSTLVIVVFVVPLALVSVALVNELGIVTRNVPAHVAHFVTPGTSVLGRLSRWIHERFALDPQTSEVFIVEQLKNAGVLLLGQSFGLLGNVLGGILRAFFVVFTMYYLFRDGEQIVQSLPRALPLTIQQSEAIIHRITEVVSASVYGVVTIAMLQGMLGGIAFWLLGVPSPILWAVLLAFICMIPIAGSFFVWLPVSIYLMFSGHWTKAVLLILWGALVISTIDNFLRPRLIKNQTKLHELFIFFSVLGGISLFGLVGIVMGPVVLAITLGLLSTFKEVGTEEIKIAAGLQHPSKTFWSAKQPSARIESRI